MKAIEKFACLLLSKVILLILEMSEFENKVIIVTGSSSGIGAGVAEGFAKQGARVVLTGRNAEKLQEVAERCQELSPSGLEALQVVCEVKNADDLQGLVEKTLDAFGQIDVLINNAGQYGNATIEDDSFMGTLDDIIASNLKATVGLIKLCSSELIKSNGCIVNISSTFARVPNNGGMAYCISKAGLDMATKVAASELGPQGVRVNGVA